MVISMVITQIVSKKNLQYATERQETIADLTGVVEEYYNGRNVIKAFNHEQESLSRSPLRLNGTASPARRRTFWSTASTR